MRFTERFATARSRAQYCKSNEVSLRVPRLLGLLYGLPFKLPTMEALIPGIGFA